LKTIHHTKQQLELAEKILNENSMEECFVVCQEIQQLVDKLVVEELHGHTVAKLKEKHSTILRRLNRVMVNSIKQKNQ